ncbi:hypothetical protein PIROE2DRAFT_69145 [Piromyces sp. E2]|nr:hypothetical protein PIROE2DRAFT_69145 [Piromyces sp. E2]|eukprot:OUM65103.1 hypothetical protein PIROE2DRAFT_69145 [Piromyces sp. E2]
MIFNILIKSILFTFIISFVIAEEKALTGDCKEIFDFFESRNKTSSLTGCDVNSDGKVTALALKSYEITEECVKKALSYNTITKLQYNKIGATPGHDPEYKLFPPEIANLTSLEELSFSYSGYRIYDRTGISAGSLKVSKSLKKLSINGFIASQSNIDDISTLTNLEYLDLSYFNRPAEKFNFDSLKNLNKLSTLELKNEGFVPLDTMPEVVYSSASTLEQLTIVGHKIGSITDQFLKLKNLKHLDLRGCELSNILDYVKDLKNLEYLDKISNISI